MRTERPPNSDTSDVYRALLVRNLPRRRSLQTPDGQDVGDGSRHVDAREVVATPQRCGDANAVLSKRGGKLVCVVGDLIVADDGEEFAFEGHPCDAPGDLADVGIAGRDRLSRGVAAAEHGDQAKRDEVAHAIFSRRTWR